MMPVGVFVARRASPYAVRRVALTVPERDASVTPSTPAMVIVKGPLQLWPSAAAVAVAEMVCVPTAFPFSSAPRETKDIFAVASPVGSQRPSALVQYSRR